MSILIAITEETNRQGTHNTPIFKLYGANFISKVVDNGTSATIILDGKRENEERIISESYTVVTDFIKDGYINFVLPLTQVGGRKIALNAESIVEISSNADGNSVVRYRDDEKIEDEIFIVTDNIVTILLSVPTTLTGLSNYRVELTQAQVRTLNSDNGGYGYELFPAPGVDKFYLITNVIYMFKADASSVMPGGTLDMYYNTGNSIINQPISNTTSIPATTYGYQPAYKDPSAIGALNEQLWLWATVEPAGYKGTLVVTFDYKLIDAATI